MSAFLPNTANTEVEVSMRFMAQFLCLALVLLWSQPATSQDGEQANTPHPGEVGELWTGSLYTSTYRVGVCISALGMVRGVLHLRQITGDVDVYHFEGTAQKHHIEAAHNSGHKFSGRLSAPDRVEGRITLKNGMKINLEGTRYQDALLDYSDCSPLPPDEEREK